MTRIARLRAILFRKVNRPANSAKEGEGRGQVVGFSAELGRVRLPGKRFQKLHRRRRGGQVSKDSRRFSSEGASGPGKNPKDSPQNAGAGQPGEERFQKLRLRTGGGGQQVRKNSRRFSSERDVGWTGDCESPRLSSEVGPSRKSGAKEKTKKQNNIQPPKRPSEGPEVNKGHAPLPGGQPCPPRPRLRHGPPGAGRLRCIVGGAPLLSTAGEPCALTTARPPPPGGPAEQPRARVRAGRPRTVGVSSAPPGADSRP